MQRFSWENHFPGSFSQHITYWLWFCCLDNIILHRQTFQIFKTFSLKKTLGENRWKPGYI